MPRNEKATGDANSPDSLVFREVNEEHWPDLDRLFESRGGPKNCWCMLWRSNSEERRAKDKSVLKAALRDRVFRGTSIGILAYMNDQPVAWCSVAPKETYRRLGEPVDPPGGTWSIACFYVTNSLRHTGMTARLITAAIETAQRHGAATVEAYPVDPDSPSYRFMGLVETFADAGFTEVARIGTRRHVMRLTLPNSSATTRQPKVSARRNVIAAAPMRLTSSPSVVTDKGTAPRSR